MRSRSRSSCSKIELAALAQAIVDDVAAGTDGMIIGIVEPPATCAPGQLELRPLEGEHPLVPLLGFVAPARWAAIGVAAGASAFPLDDPGAPRRRVQIVHFAHRSGASVSLLRDEDGEHHRPPGEPEGAIPDACRRALGLATSPAPDGTGLLWALVWLDRLVEAAGEPADRSRLASFAGVAELHPAAAPGQPADMLDAAAALYTAERPWSRLRAEPHLLPWPIAHEMTPDVAAWMDDGMLARWALSAYPDILDLVRSLAPLVDDAMSARIAEVLAAGFGRRC